MAEMVPAERLLGELSLIAVPAGLAGATLSRLAGGAAGGRAAGAARLAGHAWHARLLPKAASAAAGPKLIVASVAVVTCVAGGTFAIAHVHVHRAPPAALSVVQRPPTAQPLSRATHQARPTPSARPKRPAKKPPAPAPAPTQATVTSQRKGVSTWNVPGVSQELAESGASWYYNWAATPNGITTPAGVSFVPMISGASSVTTATLDGAKSEGNVLLGFNEPDLTSQANMTVAQALDLWPKLMATGMTLGSPAVAYDAATPGGWLDQFMAGAKARGYRVNFITVHWYGADFSTGPAVQQLGSYLQAIYERYHLPIWVTEFALTNYGGPTVTFPTEAQQAAFMTAAAAMLDGLPYVQRYAWFALPATAGSGTIGLFNAGAATEVGRAFEAAR